MLRVRVQFQQFLHRGVAGGVVFRLVEFHHRLEVLRLFLVEFEDFDELCHHAGADLLAPEDIGKVTAALLEPEQVADFGTREARFRLCAGGLVFFQELAEVRKLVYV